MSSSQVGLRTAPHRVFLIMEYRSRPLAAQRHYASSRRLLLWLTGVAALLMLLQLGNLSVRQHDQRMEQARDNLYSLRRLPYPRGNFFDSQGRPVATNRRSYGLTFSPYGMNNSDARAVLEEARALTGSPSAGEADAILETRPRWTRHELLRAAPQEQVLPFLERPWDFPGIRVESRMHREYSHGYELAHVIGYTGKIQPGETEQFARPRYLPDDDVGRAGLERSFQDRLAGHPGRERRQRGVTDPDLLESARPGENVYLTIDAELQRVAVELLDGLTGSIILMEPRTGALRVLASTPSFDPERPGASEVRGHAPGFVHLAHRGLYPPGSPFKIAGAAAALRAGIPATRTFHCGGNFRLAGWDRAFWCNNRLGHGPMDLYDSLKYSCNVYYYELGPLLGAGPIIEAGELFGFGQPTGVDLPGEASGQITGNPNPTSGQLANLVIGQGDMLATPLQVARAFAAVANRGLLPTPHVVRGVGLEDPGAGVTPESTARVPLSGTQFEAIVEGLRRASNEPGGTSHRAGFPRSWAMAGKTGTAENPRGEVDAWFAGFFPFDRPEYVVLVHVVDAGAGGGDVAAPIARRLVSVLKEGPAPPDSSNGVDGTALSYQPTP